MECAARIPKDQSSTPTNGTVFYMIGSPLHGAPLCPGGSTANHFYALLEKILNRLMMSKWNMRSHVVKDRTQKYRHRVCLFFIYPYAIYTLTAASICFLQMIHDLIDAAHIAQDARCLQGKNKILTEPVKHILQDMSRIFSSSSCFTVGASLTTSPFDIN